jgi:hypothetical protein
MNSPDKFIAVHAVADTPADVVLGLTSSGPTVEPAAFSSLNVLLDQDRASQARGKRKFFAALAALVAAGAAVFWWFNSDKPVASKWVNETVREVRLNSTSLVASGNDSKRLTVVPPESLLKREPRRSSPDEARLLEVYGLLASGDGDQALQKAQRLAADAPGFALAQLLYADLLTAQAQPAAGFGAAASEVVSAGRERLDELTDEACLLRAGCRRPW